MDQSLADSSFELSKLFIRQDCQLLDLCETILIPILLAVWLNRDAVQLLELAMWGLETQC